MFFYWHVALLSLFFVIHIVFLIHKKMSSILANQLNAGLLFIFGTLIVINGFLATPKFLKEASRLVQDESSIATEYSNSLLNVESKNFPNIYYFIFDEYAGYDSLKRYCDYDNTRFYETLEQKGFVTSKHSVNGSFDTYTEIPNLLQLRRVNTLEMPLAEKKDNLKDPYLLTYMKEHGYRINALDWENYLFIDASKTDMRMTSEFVSTYGTFDSYIYKRTAFYPFYGYQDHEKEISRMINMFAYAMESSSKAKSNLFTIGYFSFPHVPYIVDENGNKTNASDRENLRDPKPYCSQLIYANKKIIEMVNEILKNDPHSVIILQSDHGYRLPEHLRFWYGINTYDIAAEAPFMQNILSAVYYKGDYVEIDGLSGLNTLKVIFNNLFDDDLEITD